MNSAADGNSLMLGYTRQQLARRLAEAEIDHSAMEARLLLQHALNCDVATLVREDARTLSEAELAAIESLVQRRLAREPLAQIVGSKAFWKDEFMVSADVLTPRADSETLIAAALEFCPPAAKPPQHILDLGTGSGCLLLSLLREYPAAQGMGIDRSAPALAIARRNAEALGLAGRCQFTCGNWMQTLQTRYDMIITNPPYIERDEISRLEPEVRCFEPKAALDGGEDGLDAYREIANALPAHLSDKGVVIMELGAGQADAVSQLLRAVGMNVLACRKDCAGIVRALIAKS